MSLYMVAVNKPILCCITFIRRHTASTLCAQPWHRLGSKHYLLESNILVFHLEEKGTLIYSVMVWQYIKCHYHTLN